MALQSLMTQEGLTAANNANAGGFTITIPTFSVATTAGALSNTRTLATMNATWYTAAITQVSAINGTSVVYTCTIPAGVAAGVTAVQEVYLHDPLTLYTIAQPLATTPINYDPAGSVTFEITVTLASIPSSAYNLINVASVDLATHEGNAAMHPKSNLGAVVAPTVTDDAAAGYSNGSIWVDTTTNSAYVLVSPANGAANWSMFAPLSAGILNNYAAVSAPSIVNDAGSGYSVGSQWVDTVTNIKYTCVDATTGAAIWTTGAAAATVSATAPTAPQTGDIYLNTTDGFAYLWNGTAWVDITAAGAGTKNNYIAITDPLPTSDTAAGYSVGSVWVNTLTQATYMNTNAAAGAAVWELFGGTMTWVAKAGAYTAKANEGIFVDSTALPVTITLPAAPAIGTHITVVDAKGTFATNNCTLAGNGSLIMGIAAVMILNTNNRFVTLTSTGTDWRITA